jgi:hypothetical protein
VPNSRGKKRMPGTKDMPRALRCSDPVFVSFLEVRRPACLPAGMPAVVR